MYDKRKPVVKVVFGGDGAVGKSTIIRRLMQAELDTRMTPGVEIQSMKIAGQSDDFDVSSCFWDLGGQEQFRFIQDGFMKGADVVVLVYAIDFFPSYLDLNSWLGLLPEKKPPKKIFLVANKIDLSNRAVLPEEGEDFARDHGMDFYEISAKSGENFQEFQEILFETISILGSRGGEPESDFFPGTLDDPHGQKIIS